MRPFARAFAVAAAFAVLIVTSTALAAPVEISGPYVHVEDVCEKCDPSLGDVRIGEAPVPGHVRVVRRAEVMKALDREGAKVEVRSIPGRVKIRRASREASRAEMEALIVDAIERVLPEGLVLSSHGEIDSMMVPAGEFAVKARPKRGLKPGRGAVPVVFSQDGVEFRELRLTVSLSRELLLPVAAADLPEGTVVDGGWIALKRIRLDAADRPVAESPAEVIGTIITGEVKAGEPFVLSTLEKIPVVARGDGMTVETIVGSIKVRARARALQEGAVGDRIRVEVASVGKLLWVVVTGPGSGVVRQ